MPHRSPPHAARSARPARPAPLRLGVAAALGLTLAAGPAAGDTARRFVHTTEADFEPGEADGFSVTAYGELVPVPAFEALPDAPEGVDTLLTLARAGGDVYAAGGTAAGGSRVLRLAGDAWELAAEFEEAQVFCLHALGDALLVGVSAAEGGSRVVALDREDDPEEVGRSAGAALPDDRYVWAIAGGDGGVPLMVATGTEGRVLTLDGDARQALSEGGDAEWTVVLDAAQANVLALAASPGGFPVYAGTDTDGIVYRIERADADNGGKALSAAAVFDAPEPEVAALAVSGDGRVYVGTADAEQARPGRMSDAAAESTGRPEAGTTPIGDSNDPNAPPPKPEPVELAAPEAPGAVPDGDDAGPPAPTPAPDASTPEPAEEGPAGDPEDADDLQDADDAEGGTPPEADPTPADYDRLRETLRAKLEESKDSGKLDLEGVADAAAPKPSRPRTPDQPAAERKEGNAVYELLDDGSSREVFRETAMVLSLAFEDAARRLLIGTGSEGELHAVDPEDGTTTLVRDLDSQQVTALLPTDDGVLVAASNPAAAGRLPAGSPTGEAVYTSVPLDAGRRALFGRVAVAASGPEGLRLRVETRSGETADPEAAPWGPWSEAGTLAADEPAASAAVPSDPARFLQYRLTLPAREGDDTDDAPAASVDEVAISYAVPNLAPRLTRLVLESSEPGEPGEPAPPTVSISWEANDPDGDALRHDVQWRPVGAERWLTAAEGLTETSYDWNTRALGDGRYAVRVISTDAAANPPGSDRSATRRADPFLVDNTPPTIEAELEGDGPGRVTGTARDATGAVASVAFRVDDEEGYRPVNADDLLFDSAEESFELPLAGLDLDPSQPHLITLRATDTRGNASFATVAVPAD